ncbi:MAG: hypothetical protein IPL39_22065 [Opitutaceae bacterium]|nr:hypothetical protein [Opitutaceae bacterium]
MPPEPPPLADDPSLALREVRYSLPQLMRELQQERTGSVFSREILDQMEIAQIFATRRKKNARRK